MESRNKKRGFKRFFKSFTYAFDGLKYAFRYEQNLTVHILVSILVLFLGFFFQISTLEWIILFLLIGLVIGAELINTAIEATIDLVSREIHPLAKIAKDTAASAVMVFALTAFFVGLFLFLPRIWEMIYA